ncbi:hypothetical protein [Sphingomonas sp. URHD0057]|uniref:hypothetical protein n=1 Tax=Sphingomonas sp. URHD0057 TaxID=1380389 RepID=UPI000B16E071|nr:hypothetical protein [Sphingomonas sp. URHD0057]
MQLARPAFARDPRRFGKRAVALADAVCVAPALNDDLRLFALTFAAGFLFVSIVIG